MTQDWILVLGANSDMARAAARRFAQAGYNIQQASRNTEEMETEARHLQLKYGVQVQTIPFDALAFDSHSAFYAELEPKPRGVLLAFGTLGEQARDQKDVSRIRKLIDTNYTGAVSILEVIAEDFERRKCGFIVGVSSVAGDRGRQSNYLYGSAKAGLTVYLAGLRHRLHGSGINVLTVKPGFVATKMTVGLDLPDKLTAEPHEVGERIYKAVQKEKHSVYIKSIWRLIMFIIVHMPEFVFKRTKL